jgi:hypothetical protein
MSATQTLFGAGDGELPIEQVRRYRQSVFRIRGGFELPLLLAAQVEFLANPLDPMNANLHAVICQIGLQAFRPIGLPRALVGRLDLYFQPRILLAAR